MVPDHSGTLPIHRTSGQIDRPNFQAGALLTEYWSGPIASEQGLGS